MSLSSTSEMTVEYTIWPANDTYIITVCWVLKIGWKVDDFYFLIRLLSRAWLWVISTYFEGLGGMRCSSLTAESMNLIEWYVQFQQSSCTNRVWFNKTTLRKRVMVNHTGFDYIKQHFGYSGVETGVLNGWLWSRKQGSCAERVRQHKKTLSRISGNRKRNTILRDVYIDVFKD